MLIGFSINVAINIDFFKTLKERYGLILLFQRVKLAIMIIIPITMVIIAFVYVVPPGMFISLAKLGLKNEANPINRTIMPTIKAGVLAIMIPPCLVII
ncbi:hypothetical protein AKJ61_01530 [candidate division MSBL1 archaeon SCGC-AAA259B11]|uniref:Uncharacterized protein n=1 Tax=candidate division MSBL1 archaeon SCGC-AAA259B11 TaxID=1698260 RepID=A0A133U790_9EURY|nr:hypothetical protein AKJ61_01530 [candidate division MSBL1 archaeon SCGC-AAA259B11]